MHHRHSNAKDLTNTSYLKDMLVYQQLDNQNTILPSIKGTHILTQNNDSGNQPSRNIIGNISCSFTTYFQIS